MKRHLILPALPLDHPYLRRIHHEILELLRLVDLEQRDNRIENPLKNALNACSYFIWASGVKGLLIPPEEAEDRDSEIRMDKGSPAAGQMILSR